MEYDKGCMMAMTHKSYITTMKNAIDLKDLHENGMEEEPHVTMLYGIQPGVDSETIKRVLGEVSTFSINVKGIGLFKNEEFDVLHLECESSTLSECNEKLKKLPFENTYAEYKPHLTIAYLKKGSGRRYKELFDEVIEPEYLFCDVFKYSMITNAPEGFRQECIYWSLKSK